MLRESSLCLMARHIAPFISTPLFALQAKFDSWQKANICGNDCATVAGEQAYGDFQESYAPQCWPKPAMALSWIHAYTTAAQTPIETITLRRRRLPRSGMSKDQLHFLRVEMISGSRYPCTACCTANSRSSATTQHYLQCTCRWCSELVDPQQLNLEGSVYHS